jgi:lipoyl-dependent peroxiredoxin
MEPVYTVDVTTTGGRNGHATSTDGKIDMTFAMPSAMGGTGEGMTPEHMIAAAWSSCFGSSLLAVAGAQKVAIDPKSIVAKATVSFDKRESGYGLSAKLEVSAHGIAHDKLQELVTMTHENCPVSKALRGDIALVVEVV